MPVSEFARTEIERLGGPGANSDYWKLQDGDPYLPHDAARNRLVGYPCGPRHLLQRVREPVTDAPCAFDVTASSNSMEVTVPPGRRGTHGHPRPSVRSRRNTLS